MLKEYRVCPMNVNLNVSPPHIEFKGALALNNYPPNSEEVYIHEVFHCDGLLLCRTMDNRLVLWNPCLGETRWIQTKPKDMYSKFALGYEKNKSGHIYKILKFLDNTPYGRVDEFEIYDFSSDSWRVLDAIAFDCFILSDTGISLKGNTYWRAWDQINYSQFLLNFDFTAKRFTRLSLSPFQNVGMLALSVVEGKKLSLFIQRDSPSKMEMWVTNQIDANIEAVLKWSKSFTVDIPFRCDIFSVVKSYLIDEEKKVVVCNYYEYFGETSKKVRLGPQAWAQNLDRLKEILSRVPARSLKQLRSTCKRWNALFKNPRFTEKHFRKAAKESMVLMLKECRVCPMIVNLNVTPPSIEFKGALALKDSHSNSEQVDIFRVFHCDGLLLCKTKDNRLVVWNPCLGETRWIQLKDDNYERHSSRFALGYIRNNKSSRRYKILRLWGDIFGNKRFEIYEFSSDSWRVIDDFDHNCCIIGHGVSLKGNTYWLAFDFKENSTFVLIFYFREERFKCLCLPHFQDVGNMVLSVVREEQLSILNWSRTTSKMEIWITNNIDTDATLLWSKSFAVNLDTPRHYSRVFSSLLIDEEKKVALCCNISDDDETSKYMVEDNSLITPYADSLEEEGVETPAWFSLATI
ncbi:F-box-like domain superfamily [Arabidopsis thaliana x Arabidopsis arenosa]|uniref:F-box-like domain superfamily n=1 Tax=Arabidopsis thaliana x Arabidopsis arenosa TaxID=1240361 RepID=A0A8T2AUH5_9BRAS|nr:F-box-like domain superfamily [Arabidopsis thaliana x Arabidopsis arenosa]